MPDESLQSFTRPCPDCGQCDRSAFSLASRERDGTQVYCKPCHEARRQRSRALRRERGLIPPGRLRRIKPSAAFFAGFFDGEGSISIGKHQNRSTWWFDVCVSQTSSGILEMFKDRYGGGVYTWGKRKENEAPLWVWSAAGPKAEDFLGDVGPYLVVKYERACVALEYRALFKPPNRIPTVGADLPTNRPHVERVLARRHDLVVRMRLLNLRGKDADAIRLAAALDNRDRAGDPASDVPA